MKTYKVTSSKKFKFSNNLIVQAEFSDTTDKFAFRLRCFEFTGEWQFNYEGFAKLIVGERKFAMCSAYRNGSIFPVETPFEVTTGHEA